MVEPLNTQNENLNAESVNSDAHTNDESQMPDAVDKRLFPEYTAKKQVGKYLKHHTNTIAKAMKILAIIFWAASTIALLISWILIWYENYGTYTYESTMSIGTLLYNLLAVMVSGAILFALGEVIQILHDIRAGKTDKNNGAQ
jgi:hypothetical protein